MIPPVVGSTTNGLAISSKGKLLCDVDYNAQTVWLYNTYGQSQSGGITPLSYPLGIALSPDGRLVYVTNNNCAGTIAVFVTVFPLSEARLVHRGD